MARKHKEPPIDKSIKDLLNIDIDRDDSKDWSPKTREELLAWDLAVALKDEKAFPFYLSRTRRYPEAFLRKVLSEVMKVPGYKIKKSRGALFNHLVKKHSEDTGKLAR